MLTIAYMTSRKIPKLEWFLSSLANETGGDFSSIKVVIVDYWANPFGGTKQMHEARRQYVVDCIDAAGIPHEAYDWMSPKGNPWQGKQRQTLEDWFNVANSRNTAVCMADGEWIAFVDDLSVIKPGWLALAGQAMMQTNMITIYRYQKVRDLVVENGNIVSFTEFPGGIDSRSRHVRDLSRVHTPCPPDWHFGYTIGPLQAYLDVNGWVESDTAGLSFEDVPTGINLGKKGYAFRYDPRMLVYESEELHGQEGGMRRGDYGVSPRDKSHAVLTRARSGDGWAKNDFFNGMTLAQLRDHVHAKASNAFPAPRPNQREWFTGRLLSDPNLGADFVAE